MMMIMNMIVKKIEPNGIHNDTLYESESSIVESSDLETNVNDIDNHVIRCIKKSSHEFNTNFKVQTYPPPANPMLTPY